MANFMETNLSFSEEPTDKDFLEVPVFKRQLNACGEQVTALQRSRPRWAMRARVNLPQHLRKSCRCCPLHIEDDPRHSKNAIKREQAIDPLPSTLGAPSVFGRTTITSII